MRRRVVETAASSYHNRVIEEKGSRGLGLTGVYFKDSRYTTFSVSHFNIYRRFNAKKRYGLCDVLLNNE